MMIGYRARKRLSLLVLLVGLPLYIVVAVTAVDWLDAAWGHPPFWVEILVYVALGFLWLWPCKALFTGIGQPDPDQTQRRRP